MVDVDMADAGSSAPAKGKLVGPAKGKSPEGGGLDGKKRFEVKKVGSRHSAMGRARLRSNHLHSGML